MSSVAARPISPAEVSRDAHAVDIGSARNTNQMAENARTPQVENIGRPAGTVTSCTSRSVGSDEGGLALFRAGHPVIVHPRAVSARNRQTAPSTKIANQTSTFSTQTACTGSPVSGACTRWPSPYRGVNEATRSSVEPAGIG